jgi:hypothetical protein
LEKSFFDGVCLSLEAKMATGLFSGFMSSKFYTDYKEAVRLKNQLETVIEK